MQIYRLYSNNSHICENIYSVLTLIIQCAYGCKG
nr:MAG TPA: hypothetical protein [Caudoviricetes sp.]